MVRKVKLLLKRFSGRRDQCVARLALTHREQPPPFPSTLRYAENVLDNATTLYTALSVGLEALTRIIDESPQRLELGYARAATVDAKKEMDGWLEDNDINHLTRANSILQTANRQMEKWGHHV